MAVVSHAQNSVLVVTFQTGVTTAGSPQLRQRSFNNVKADALDQDVYDVAQAIYGLQQYPLTGVRRDNCFDLTQA